MASKYPDDRDNTRANAFRPRWTGLREVCEIVSIVSVRICDPTTGKEEGGGESSRHIVEAISSKTQPSEAIVRPDSAKLRRGI